MVHRFFLQTENQRGLFLLFRPCFFYTEDPALLEAFDFGYYSSRSCDPRDPEFWSPHIPPLWDLDSNGTVVPLAPEKMQPWEKHEIHEKMQERIETARLYLDFCTDIVFSFIMDENGAFYKSLISVPFLTQDCFGFFANPWLFIEVRFKNPLLFTGGFDFQFYSVIRQMSKPTHLQFDLVHSHGEYSQLSLPRLIPSPLKTAETTLTYEYLYSGITTNKEMKFWSTFLWHEKLRGEVLYTAMNMEAYKFLLGDMYMVCGGMLQLCGGTSKRIIFLTFPIPFSGSQNYWHCSQSFFPLALAILFLGQRFFWGMLFFGEKTLKEVF